MRRAREGADGTGRPLPQPLPDAGRRDALSNKDAAAALRSTRCVVLPSRFEAQLAAEVQSVRDMVHARSYRRSKCLRAVSALAHPPSEVLSLRGHPSDSPAGALPLHRDHLWPAFLSHHPKRPRRSSRIAQSVTGGDEGHPLYSPPARAALRCTDVIERARQGAATQGPLLPLRSQPSPSHSLQHLPSADGLS